VAGINDKSKKQSASIRMRQERRITVSSIVYDQKNKLRESDIRATRPVLVPWIRIQGKWLEQAGFGIHTPVRIRVMRGCLVLTVD
jgi:type I toxin-antitoxin system toxin SymE